MKKGWEADKYFCYPQDFIEQRDYEEIEKHDDIQNKDNTMILSFTWRACQKLIRRVSDNMPFLENQVFVRVTLGIYTLKPAFCSLNKPIFFLE